MCWISKKPTRIEVTQLTFSKWFTQIKFIFSLIANEFPPPRHHKLFIGAVRENLWIRWSKSKPTPNLWIIRRLEPARNETKIPVQMLKLNLYFVFFLKINFLCWNYSCIWNRFRFSKKKVSRRLKLRAWQIWFKFTTVDSSYVSSTDEGN
jgi:hypothetical protein